MRFTPPDALYFLILIGSTAPDRFIELIFRRLYDFIAEDAFLADGIIFTL